MRKCCQNNCCLNFENQAKVQGPKDNFLFPFYFTEQSSNLHTAKQFSGEDVKSKVSGELKVLDIGIKNIDNKAM